MKNRLNKIKDYENTIAIREEILKLACKSGEGHIASSFSIVELLYCLYFYVLDTKKDDVKNNKDTFILSKGHAALALYILLNKTGVFSKKVLNSFSTNGSVLGGHPDRLLVPGVEVSTGSLGHGLPIGCGIAIAKKLNNSSSRVIVLVGDGELNEGSNWESILFAKQHDLSNLYLIVDNNLSSGRSTMVKNLSKVFKSFGWNTVEIDGHNIDDIKRSFYYKNNNRPNVIIANTIKGKGLREMENNPEWHHKSPTSDQLKRFIVDLY